MKIELKINDLFINGLTSTSSDLCACVPCMIEIDKYHAYACACLGNTD